MSCKRSWLPTYSMVIRKNEAVNFLNISVLKDKGVL